MSTEDKSTFDFSNIGTNELLVILVPGTLIAIVLLFSGDLAYHGRLWGQWHCPNGKKRGHRWSNPDPVDDQGEKYGTRLWSGGQVLQCNKESCQPVKGDQV